jgi:protein-S-isoprenylcysteine O-methyltransferase Ste14
MFLTILNILGILIAWIFWLWLAERPYSPVFSVVMAVGGSLVSIPLVFLGRWLLDRQPSVQRAIWITTFIHYLILTPMGGAIIEASRFAQNQNPIPLWTSPLPAWVGLGIMIVSGVVLVLVIFNLALKGLGAPFAIALTRVVATDWLYAWTRNPMVLSAFAFLLGLGLWLKSNLFVLWLLIVLSPAIFIFLRVYEERELEIRFGDAYLAYKAETPMLWPGRPSKGSTSSDAPILDGGSHVEH